MLKACSVLIMLFCVLFGSAVLAHPLAPILWEFTETDAGQVAMSWKISAAKIPGDDLVPQLPVGCQKSGADERRRVKNFWVYHYQLRCEPSWIGSPFSVAGISTNRSQVILRIRLVDKRSYQRVLNADTPSFRIPERVEADAVFRSYLDLGFHHILTGWDHLLFVLGLFLLIKPSKLLLWTITAFTIGHSITLSLAALELIFVSSAVIEVLIAVSILILALELLRDQKIKVTFFHRYTWVMAFSFGLLHGMGFAGALAEAGLPTGEIPLALFSFNIGIEGGQLLFIAVLGILRKAMPFLPFPVLFKRIEVPAYVIGSLAVFWVFERLSEAGFAWN